MKRFIDVTASLVALVVASPLVLVLWVAATVDTGANGIYRQVRVGLNGRYFKINKLRTMESSAQSSSSVTTGNDPRVTRLGRMLRRTKLDELPQLWNVLAGTMSLVGPRPDVPGFADTLQGEDRDVLSVRPGITGPAQLYFRDEERLLALHTKPEEFNRHVLYPAKVQINRAYVTRRSLIGDFALIIATVAPRLRRIWYATYSDVFDSVAEQIES